jgi:hypothetical protein
MVWLTIAPGALPARSAPVKALPRNNSMPIVAK